ncbi:MAG: class I SAM-dependent methyltransferase [Chloroflexi bacterium]|nr:class I SAM-dependent methyltransferase [Chloroflexota bacterium]
MPTKFPLENAEALLSQSRPGAVDPNYVVAELPLRTFHFVADIGCGPGYLTIPLAKYLYDGKVYAIDVQQGMLDIVEREAKAAHVQNVETVLSRETKLPLEDNSVDLALMSNVLHEASYPTRLIRDAARIVKKGGWIAILEWRKQEMRVGPPLDERVAQEDVEEILEKLELTVKARRIIGDIRYLLLVEK